MPKMFVRAITVTLFLGSLALVAGCPSTPPPAPPPQEPLRGMDFDDDDRPPIIVYNGTLEFKALAVKGNPGKWDPQGGPSNGPWIHLHANGGPVAFEVSVIAGTTGPCVDERGNDYKDFVFKKVDKAVFTFDQGNDDTATVSVKKGGGNDRWMEVALGASKEGTATGDLLSIGKGGTYLRVLKMELQGNHTAECKFGTVALVVVGQRN